jgi:hypothetical protein
VRSSRKRWHAWSAGSVVLKELALRLRWLEKQNEGRRGDGRREAEAARAAEKRTLTVPCQ